MTVVRAAEAPARRDRADLPDPEIMRGLTSGDLGLLAQLYDRYHDDVRQFARRASALGDADDIVQDTFLAAARSAASFDGRPSARPFLIGIAARLVWKRRRLLGRWTEVLTAFGWTQSAASARTPEDDAERAERAAWLDRALGRLSDDKRLVLLLVEREGMTGEEVAAALGIPVGTVWTRLHHARADMRRALSRRGSPLGASGRTG
jgi:RNA polymerase sigma-70 factor (ECF subfamily)